MPHNAVFWLVAAFVIRFFFVGVPYWQIPYAKVSLPSTWFDTGLLVVGILTAAARAFVKSRLLAVILAVGVAVSAPISAPGSGGEQKSPFSSAC